MKPKIEEVAEGDYLWREADIEGMLYHESNGVWDWSCACAWSYDAPDGPIEEVGEAPTQEQALEEMSAAMVAMAQSALDSALEDIDDLQRLVKSLQEALAQGTE